MRAPVRSGTGRPAALKAASITVLGSAHPRLGAVIGLSAQCFRRGRVMSECRIVTRLVRNAIDCRLRLRIPLPGSSGIKPPRASDQDSRGDPRFQEKRTRSATTILARRGKRHTVPHTSDAVGLKPRLAVCVLPDAAGMPPDLFFA